MENQKKIIIVAGEASGDIHAANLVKAIKSLNPNCQFFGLGGVKMQEAGVELFYNLADLAVVGFVEVIKNLKKFKKIFKDLLNKINAIKPDAVILVDYPGFNLRLAEEVKKQNIKVIYYISPQVWAWGANRIEKIRHIVDKMIVILKFEEELYYNSGVDVSFVGHPLLDIAIAAQARDDFREANSLSSDDTVICLLPGSRETEIKRLLPVMLKAAKIIYSKITKAKFIIVKSHTLNEAIYTKYMRSCATPMKIIENNTYDCLNACDFALVASGTATLETAIFKKPMAILYRTSFLTWLLAKNLIKIPYIGLVNVVATKKVVPEFIQFECRPEEIAKEVIEILSNREKYSRIKFDLEKIGSLLGSPGASARTAEIILNSISIKNND